MACESERVWLSWPHCMSNNLRKYLDPLGSWQSLFHPLGNGQCCSRRRNTLRQTNNKQAFADVSHTPQLKWGCCVCVLLSWSAKLKSPSYRPSLKAIPQTVSRSFRAGTFAPPVSGIHHCLQEMEFIFTAIYVGNKVTTSTPPQTIESVYTFSLASLTKRE